MIYSFQQLYSSSYVVAVSYQKSFEKLIALAILRFDISLQFGVSETTKSKIDAQ